MAKKILVGVLVVVALSLTLLLGGLLWAHWGIRRARVPLPLPEALAATAAGGPVRLSFVNTASQEMPRGAVLDATRDPHPSARYVMSHPSFVLEWDDGRILLVDTGMTRDGAADFGEPIQMLSGGQPITPLGSVVERLGQAVDRVHGVIFTHLHVDHVGGIGDLCGALRHGLRVFMTRAQAEVVNYTTRPGHRLLDGAHCVEAVTLPDRPSPLAVPGFDGVSVIAAGGHTPGSQLIVAHVGRGPTARRYAFVGDIVNNIDGISHDVPKPLFYRVFIVPEDGARQAELRHLLRRLRDEQAFGLLVSHDQLELERSGIPAWHGLGD